METQLRTSLGIIGDLLYNHNLDKYILKEVRNCTEDSRSYGCLAISPLMLPNGDIAVRCNQIHTFSNMIASKDKLYLSLSYYWIWLRGVDSPYNITEPANSYTRTHMKSGIYMGCRQARVGL